MTDFAYMSLFSVAIHHAYFLNSGEAEFEDLEEKIQAKIIDKYNWSNFFEITPTPKTIERLKNNHLIMKSTPSSFRILVRVSLENDHLPFVQLDADLQLFFTIKYRDPFFENYTDMNFLEQDKMIFSNIIPPEVDPDIFQPLGLESEGGIFDQNHIIGSETYYEILRNERIGADQTLKGLIIMGMHGASGNLNIINVNGTLKVNPASFLIRFNNRKTHWKYILKAHGLIMETLFTKPLTHGGFVSIDVENDFGSPPIEAQAYQFPNPDIKLIKYQEDKYYSEIFI